MLDVEIAIDERHRKLLGFDIQARCTAALEPLECELTHSQIVSGGGMRQRAVETVDARGKRARQDIFPQAREQHQVAASQQAQRRQQRFIVFIAQIGQDHHQRTLAQPPHQIERGDIII